MNVTPQGVNADEKFAKGRQEESDDEDEFEDIRPEKYVHLNRIYNMKCVYNRKFDRWQPLKIEKDKQIVKHENIYQIEKK